METTKMFNLRLSIGLAVLSFIGLTGLTAPSAFADPEQAYKGGKAMSDMITGKDTLHFDDRDLEQRVRDYLREAGAKAGQKDTPEKDSSAKAPAEKAPAEKAPSEKAAPEKEPRSNPGSLQ